MAKGGVEMINDGNGQALAELGDGQAFGEIALLRACECIVRRALFPLILRSGAKRSVSKDGNAKDEAAALERCIGTVPVATLRDTPLRSVPQGEAGV